MDRQRWLILLTALYLTGSFVRFIWLEEPRGRLEGRVIASDTGQPLAHVHIFIEGAEGTWERWADGKGFFSIASLPAGLYRLSAYTRAYEADSMEIVLKEGERLQLLIPLRPKDPFLEVLNPQPVFHTGEPVRIYVRGFVPDPQLSVRVLRLHWKKGAVPLTRLLSFLSEIGWGWWEGPWRLRSLLRTYRTCFENYLETEVPIGPRDPEGVFTQYVTVDIKDKGAFLALISAGSLLTPALIVRTPTGALIKAGKDGQGRSFLFGYVADLVSGNPVASVPVHLIGRTREGGVTADRVIAKGLSDSKGLISFDLSRFSLEETPELYLVAFYNGAPTYWVRLDEEDLRSVIERDSDHVVAVFTDRPIYRPGDTVRFKGVVRKRTAAGYAVPIASTQTVPVLVRGPDGDLIGKQVCSLNSFGSFSGELILPEFCPTGSFSFYLADFPERSVGEFTVASYRKPSVLLRVRPAKRRFTKSERIQIHLSARYAFGMPAAHQLVGYSLSRSPLTDGYLNGWEEGGGEVLRSGELRLDKKGEAIASFSPIPEEKSPFTDYQYEFSAWMAELPVDATSWARFQVTAADWRLELSSSPGFCHQGEEVTVRARLSRWDDGKPVRGSRVRLRWGYLVWSGDRQEVQWVSPPDDQQTDSKGMASFRVPTDRPGEMVIEGTVQDSNGNVSGSQTSVWVEPWSDGVQAPPPGPVVQVWTDRDACRPGETVKVVVRSRVQEGFVLLSLEGSRLWDAQILPLRAGRVNWSFPYESQYGPNIFVEACLVYKKRLESDFREVTLNMPYQRLKIEVNTDKKTYRPREMGTVRIKVRDEQGKPAPADLSVSIVDETVFSLKEEDPELLVRTFYSRSPNAVLTRYSFPWLGWQGDKGEVQTVREYFPDTALWVPHLVTDGEGEAEATFKVPDTLTTWRISVRGHTKVTRLGYGRTQFICAIPFAVQLSLPAVLTEGDNCRIRATVHNDTDRTVRANVRVSAQWKGPPSELRLSSAQPSVREQDLAPQTVEVLAHSTKTLSWGWEPKMVGQWQFIASATAEGGLKDAERRSLKVIPHGTFQKIVKVIHLDQTRRGAFYRFRLADASDPDHSLVHVRLSPSVLSGALGAVEYLASYPYGCTEQTVNTFLPTALLWNLMKKEGLSAPYLDRTVPDMVRQGVARLSRLQHSSGGWGWWEEDETDLLMTALVVRGLAVAKRAGYAVPERMFREGAAALERLVRTEEEDLTNLAFGLFVLAEVGSVSPQMLRSQIIYLLSQRAGLTPESWDRVTEQLSPAGHAFLALAWLILGEKQRAAALTEKLLARSDPTVGYLWWTSRGDGFVNDEETTAWCLLTVMKLGGVSRESLLPSIAALLSRRKGAGWTSTKDTAAALEALTEFASRFEKRTKRPISVSLSLNGREKTATLPSLSPWEPETVIPLDGSLNKGENVISLRLVSDASLFATVEVQQLIRFPETGRFQLAAGAGILRKYQRLERETGPEQNWEKTDLEPGSTVRSGDWIVVTLKGESPWDYAIIEDPIPGGCLIPLDPQVYRGAIGWDAQVPTEVRDDRVICVLRGQGPFAVQYLMRASVPGDFHVLPTRLWTMYGVGSRVGGEDRLRIVP